jgi:hypothetical protein
MTTKIIQSKITTCDVCGKECTPFRGFTISAGGSTDVPYRIKVQVSFEAMGEKDICSECLVPFYYDIIKRLPKPESETTDKPINSFSEIINKSPDQKCALDDLIKSAILILETRYDSFPHHELKHFFSRTDIVECVYDPQTIYASINRVMETLGYVKQGKVGEQCWHIRSEEAKEAREARRNLKKKK